MKTTSIPLDKIDKKAGTQIRVRINHEVVNEYAECMKNGDRFPHVVLFKCKENRKNHYILADGFHRCLAAEQNKHKTITCEIIEGNERDALEYALKANAAHGLKRSNQDKRKAVTIALRDEEWAQYSNNEIARLCAVSEFLVRSIRKESSSRKSKISKNISFTEVKRKVKRGGKTYIQKVYNIGKNSKKELDETEISLKKSLNEFLPKTLIVQLKRFSSQNDLELETIIKRALRSYLES